MMNQGINMGMLPGAYQYRQGIHPKNQEVTEIDLRELFAEVQTMKSDDFAILGHDFDPPYNVFTPIGV